MQSVDLSSGHEAGGAAWRFRLAGALARQSRIGTLLFWTLAALAVALGAALAIALARQAPPGWQISREGTFQGSGVYLGERDSAGQSFRWLSGSAALRLPSRQTQGLLALRLQPGLAPGPAQVGFLHGHGFTLRPDSQPRSYAVLVTPAMVRQDELVVAVRSTVFRAPNDERELGLRLQGLGWQPLGDQAALGRWLGGLLALTGLGLGAIVARDWGQRRAAFAPAAPTAAAPIVRPRLDFIDGLRGMAVLMVVVAHSWIHTTRFDLGLGWAPQTLGVGAIGVHLFLVLSGFCLAYPLIQADSFKPQRIGYFFQRRLVRIVPPYYAAIAFFALAPFIAALLTRTFGNPVPTVLERPTAAGVASHLLFSHNLVGGIIPGVNGSFWSLELELHFYLLFPLLIALAARYGALRMAAGVLVVTLAWRIAIDRILTPQSSPSLHVGLAWAAPGRLFEFALGILAAVIVVRQPRRLKILPAAYLAAGLALIWYGTSRIVPLQGQFSAFPDIVIGLGFFLIVLAASRGWLNRLFAWRPLVWVGTISYSIYLIHEPLLREGYRWLPGLSGWTAFWAYTVGGGMLMVAAGFLFYQAVEVPSLAWGRRLAKRQAAEPLQRSEAHSAP